MEKPNRRSGQRPAWLITTQGLYYLATGIWPVIHMNSFLSVTGPKTDIWLVKMVAVLSCAIGITLLMPFKAPAFPVKKTLGICCAAAFGLIDVYYVLAGVIAGVYLFDAFIQVVFIVSAIFAGAGYRSKE